MGLCRPTLREASFAVHGFLCILHLCTCACRGSLTSCFLLEIPVTRVYIYIYIYIYTCTWFLYYVILIGCSLVPQILMGVFQLGFITILLSESLVSGYTTGAAVHVFTSQLRHIFGVEINATRGIASVPIVCDMCTYVYV